MSDFIKELLLKQSQRFHDILRFKDSSIIPILKIPRYSPFPFEDSLKPVKASVKYVPANGGHWHTSELLLDFELRRALSKMAEIWEFLRMKLTADRYCYLHFCISEEPAIFKHSHTCQNMSAFVLGPVHMRRKVFPLTEVSLVDRRDLGIRENICAIWTQLIQYFPA